MFKGFFLHTKYRVWAWVGLVALMSITSFQVYLTVLLNSWYARFYNILQKAEDIDGFWSSMIEFSYIAMTYVVVASFLFWLAQHYAFRWREAINNYYIPLWSKCDGNIEGASQRIQQDTYEFSKFLEKFGLGIFKAVLTLVAFIPILWNISSNVTIPFFKDIEGSLFYLAFLTSFGGIFVSFLVGIKLPNIEYENQKKEAAYRKSLVYSEDDKDYAKSETLFDLFLGVKANYFKLFNHYSYFTLWENIYGQVMIILPYLVMAPSLFVGVITLGIVTQTGNAFGKVNESFSYFIVHWIEITKFLSVIKRLREFEILLEERAK
jgi:peptide/bleomycin uptake transporter